MDEGQIVVKVLELLDIGVLLALQRPLVELEIWVPEGPKIEVEVKELRP